MTFPLKSGPSVSHDGFDLADERWSQLAARTYLGLSGDRSGHSTPIREVGTKCNSFSTEKGFALVSWPGC